MKNLCCFIRSSLLLGVLSFPMSAAIVQFNGNAYSSSGTPATSNVRATWGGNDPLLTWDNVILNVGGTSECTSPCGYSYNRTPTTNVNVSGKTISGVLVTGSNPGAAGNNLEVRSLTEGNRNQGNGPNYNQLNSSTADFTTVLWPQWKAGFATAAGVTGAPSITIKLPTGTRSFGFDYGTINGVSSSSYTITTTSISTTAQTPTASTYSVGGTYNTNGPGFYGATSTDDIVTVTITANTSTSQWILNIANIRFGTAAAAAPVPEISTQFTLGAGLITISFLLRKRSKNSSGGTA